METVNNISGLGLLRQPSTVLFGTGRRHQIPQLVSDLGSSVLVCTDERMAGTPECSQLVAGLKARGVEVAIFSETQPDLPRENIMQVLAAFSSEEIEVVIGLGGGSCLDMAKTAALMLRHGGDVRDYYGENQVPGPALPILTVPTTAGTGAEISNFAVVFDAERGMKVGVGSAHILPRVAVIDPELTLSCPPGLTAATASDALSHLVESFTDRAKNPSSEELEHHLYVGKNVLTDVYCREGLRLMAHSMGAVATEPSNLQARSDVMFAAYCGGMALNTAGTAACHALQAPIGNLTHTAHGFGVGALLPYVMRFNLPAHIEAFAELSRAVGVFNRDLSELDNAKAGIIRVDELLDSVGCPADLAALGLEQSDIPQVASQALLATRLTANNPRALNQEFAEEILRRAHSGDRRWWPMA